ncbi:MAG TPA: anti-sigma factor [Thermosynechococcaceae cyanobacterium]
MTDHLPPEQLDELLAGYALGDLSPEEAETLQQQLAENPSLAAEVQQLQRVLEVMPYALPSATPSDRLRAQVLVAAQPTPIAPTRNRQRAVWGMVAGAAALLVGAIGLDNLRLRQQVDGLQAQVAKQQDQVAKQQDVVGLLQQPKTYLVSLKGKDQAAAASGSIVLAPGEPKAVLALRNLPALAPGQYYQLWVIAEGQKIPWDRFNPNDRGSVFTQLSLPNNQITTLAVTVEAAPVATQPTGPMVMTTGL